VTHDADAFDVSWRVTAVLADGSRRSRSLRAPAPPKSSQTGEQRQKLESGLGEWAKALQAIKVIKTTAR
jgi:hypothetical protein